MSNKTNYTKVSSAKPEEAVVEPIEVEEPDPAVKSEPVSEPETTKKAYIPEEPKREHSAAFADVREKYEDGRYTAFGVRLEVLHGDIQPEEYEEITGDKYDIRVW